MGVGCDCGGLCLIRCFGFGYLVVTLGFVAGYLQLCSLARVLLRCSLRACLVVGYWLLLVTCCLWVVILVWLLCFGALCCYVVVWLYGCAPMWLFWVWLVFVDFEFAGCAL